jgi:hypothetical protein
VMLVVPDEREFLISHPTPLRQWEANKDDHVAQSACAAGMACCRRRSLGGSKGECLQEQQLCSGRGWGDGRAGSLLSEG